MTIRSIFQKGTVVYLLDVLVGVLVLDTLNVAVWRGLWLLLKLTITPDSLEWRGLIVFTTSHLIMISVIILQYPARKLTTELHSSHPWLQILFEDVFITVAFAGSLMYWLGLWELLTVLFKGHHPHLAQWMLHIVGYGVLTALRVSTSLQFKGYFIDGEFPQGMGIIQTPNYYRTFMWRSSDTVQEVTVVLDIIVSCI